MQANQDKVENLHQQAAAYYLQGEFEKALAYWQELLSVDSEDERAQEGVRLCEMLADEARPAAAAVSPSGSPQQGMEPAPLSEEKLDWDLSKLDLGTTQVDTVAVLPPPPEVRAETGLNELPDLEAIGHGPADDDGEDLELGGLEGLGAALDASMPADGIGGAAELASRVDELILQATKSYEAGDSESALSAVSRVFILDENNTAAMNLQQAIQAETAPPPEEPVLDEPALELDLPAAPLEPLLDDLEEASGPDPTDIPMEGLETIRDGVRAAQRLAAQADPGKARGARLLSRKFLLIYAVGLVVVLAAGWGVLKFVGRSADPALDVAVREMQAIPTENPVKNGKSGKKGEKDKKVAEASVTPLSPAELPDLIARAEAAIVAEEFSQAIIAYNQVLEIDPDHKEAKAGLAVAGERYRDQRAFEKTMTTASDAWERGDYRTAMRIYYRLPQAADNPRFDRYKRNGWYNLSLRAIGTGNCKDAQEHFEELRLLGGDDSAAPLEALVGRCGLERTLPEFKQQAQALPLRQLED